MYLKNAMLFAIRFLIQYVTLHSVTLTLVVVELNPAQI